MAYYDPPPAYGAPPSPPTIPELLMALERALPAAPDNGATLQAVQEALERVNVRWVTSAKAVAELTALERELSDVQTRVRAARADLQLADTSVSAVADGLRNLRTRLLLGGHKYSEQVDSGAVLAVKAALEDTDGSIPEGTSDEHMEILQAVRESMDGPPVAWKAERARAFNEARALLKPETYAEMRARHAREDATWKGVGEALRAAFPKEE